MRARQAQFYDFIMARVQEGKEDEAKAILDERLSRGRLGVTPEYRQQFRQKLKAVIDPKYLDEIITAFQSIRR